VKKHEIILVLFFNYEANLGTDDIIGNQVMCYDAYMVLLDAIEAAGMNPQETLELTEFIAQIRDKYNLSIFMIEHHMDLVMEISDRVYVLDFGKNIASGTANKIANNPKVIEAYLGVSDDVED